MSSRRLDHSTTSPLQQYLLPSQAATVEDLIAVFNEVQQLDVNKAAAIAKQREALRQAKFYRGQIEKGVMINMQRYDQEHEPFETIGKIHFFNPSALQSYIDRILQSYVRIKDLPNIWD